MTNDGSDNRADASDGRSDGDRETAAVRSPGRVDALRERWHRTKIVLRAPRVHIEVYGDAEAQSVYRAFTARHPRFKLTSAKRWGVALLALPASREAYLSSVSRSTRRSRTKALSMGYRHIEVPPGERIDEIVAVNRSIPSRQGRPMTSLYLQREMVVASIGARPVIHAIIDGDGTLQAYANVLDLGGTFALSFLIGHADRLADGIMHLLVAEVVGCCIAARRPDGSPAWLMADTFWGASSGLAYFKERTGFRPYTIDWTWVDPPQPSRSAPD